MKAFIRARSVTNRWAFGGYPIYPEVHELKRIAFLGRGAHTLPTYRALLNLIAKRYELIVYSEVPIEKEWLDLEHTYSLRAAISKNLPRRIRELLFVSRVIADHLKQRFDLVHAHSTYPTGFAAVILQRIFNVPAIVALDGAEASGLPDISFGDLLHTRRTKVNRWVINHATTVTALTRFQREEVFSNLKINREILVISRGVDLKRFYFERTQKPGGPLVILSVGYLNPIKDPRTLMHAFYRIQKQIESVLIIVGMDYMQGAIQRLAGELNVRDRVRFEGYVPHERISEYYRRADVLLHTSRYESQGMVIAEALASGVLVVGTKVGLLNDLSGDCCLTAATNDPETLARIVTELWANDAEMRRLRENGYRWSRSHSLERCAGEIMNIYKAHTDR